MPSDRHVVTAPPSRYDRVARALTGWLGGAAGWHVRLTSNPRAPLIAIVLVTTLATLIGLWQKSACYVTGWNRDNSEFMFNHTCYSDIAILYRERGLSQGKIPYFDTGDYPVLEYPVLTGAVMYVTAWISRHLDHGSLVAHSLTYFDVNVVLLFLMALIAAWSVMVLSGARRWDALLFAGAPALVLSGTINWDLVAVALTGLSMVAWARRHPWLAGVLLGLGAATKFYPIVLVGPFLVLAIRTGRFGGWLKLVGGGVLAWLAVNLPVMIGAPEQWRYFFDSNNARAADFGSIWLVFFQAGHGLKDVNHTSLLLFGIGCSVIGVLALLAPKRPRLAQLAFLVVAAFLVVNKVYSPQYVLWLLPLAILARPKVRDILIWQAFEVFYWLMVWMYLAGLYANHPIGRLYWWAIIARVLATLWFAGMVVWDMFVTSRDPVRAREGVDDPAGGEFDGAPDANWRRLFRPSGDAVEPLDVGAGAAQRTLDG
jgi:uncharacterized membrane protein